MKCRRDGLSKETLKHHRGYLRLASSVVDVGTTGQQIREFLDFLRCSNDAKHAYYRTLRAFYNWLYSPKSGSGRNPQDNPMLSVDPPKVETRILAGLANLEARESISMRQSGNDSESSDRPIGCEPFRVPPPSAFRIQPGPSATRRETAFLVSPDRFPRRLALVRRMHPSSSGGFRPAQPPQGGFLA